MSHSSIEICLKSSSLAASFLRMPGGFEKNVIHFDKTAKVMSDWDDRNRWSHKITAVSNCLDRNHWNHVVFLMGHAWPDISGHFQNFGMIHPLLRRYLWCDSWFSEGARLSLHLSWHRLRPRCRLVEWSRFWMHEMFGVLYVWCTYVLMYFMGLGRCLDVAK